MKKINSLVLLLLLSVTAMAQSLNLHLTNGSIIRYPLNNIWYLDATETDIPGEPNENYGWDNTKDRIVTGGMRTPGPGSITLLGYVNAPVTEYSEVGIAYRLKDSAEEMTCARSYIFDWGTDNRRFSVGISNLAPGAEYTYCAYMKDANGQLTYANEQLTFKTSDECEYIYIIGSCNDWIEPSADNEEVLAGWRLYETETGSYIYTGEFNMPTGDLLFRLYTSLSGWDSDVSLGSQVQDAGVECDFNDDGVFAGTFVKGKGLWSFRNFEGGRVNFIVNLKENTVILVLSGPFYSYYLYTNSGGNMNIADPETCENYMFYKTDKTTFTYTTFWPNNSAGKSVYNTKVWEREAMLVNSVTKTWGFNGTARGNRTEEGDFAQPGQWLGPLSEGWYTFEITMDEENETHSYKWTAIDEPTTSYTNISIIGTINGDSWTTDYDLTQCSSAPHNWYLMNFSIPEGVDLKFRANHGWEKSWGGDGSKSIGRACYTLPAGYKNIKVSAGTYNFYLNDITGEWSIFKVW